MGLYLGIDTSNYTTSVAIYDSDSKTMISEKRLLPVKHGERGLMQSSALFEHTRQLPMCLEAAFSSFNDVNLNAVAVSDKPRNVSGSYMPVFLAGVSSATAAACSSSVTLYRTSHQVGHILSALYSTENIEFIHKPFIAFHVSGGTTEALLVTPHNEEIISCEIVARSLDLKAGQAIDRAGVLMGLDFPCGAKMDELAQNGTSPLRVKPTIIGNDCSLSGLENKFKNLIDKNESNENVSRFIFEYLAETIEKMSLNLREKYGDIPFVYAGGVMSNSIIKSKLESFGGLFCEPRFSSDNAAGVAIFAYLKDLGV